MDTQHFEAIARLAPVGLFRTDARGSCVYVNERWCEITGLAPEAALGEGWSQALHPEDRARVAAEWAHAARVQGNFTSEYRFQRPDGRITWVLGQGTPERGPSNTTGGYIGSITDITARKRAEDALRRMQEDHAGLVNAVEGIVWEADLGSLDFRFVSQQAERLLGYPLSEWFDTPNAWIKYLHPEDRDRVIDYCVAETNAGRDHDFEYRMIAADGRIVWLRDLVRISVDADGRKRLRGVMVDITALMQAEHAMREAKERAESSSIAKSRFLATMSHELRTPLNAIMGFADVMRGNLLGEAGSARYRSYAEDIHTSASHLLQIINDMLDVARIEAGKFDIAPEMLAPVDVLSEVHQIMATEAASVGLVLAVDLGGAGAAPLRADRRALRQILLNLVSNAVKYTPAGGTVTLGAHHEPGIGTRLWVADTGIGIAASDVARLGQPFVQLDTAYLEKRQGVGLGLMLVRSLVSLHGGTMAIDSALGRGTTVTIQLPETNVLEAAE